VEEWERWFSEAVWDLETAEILHSARRYNAAVFYAQQAAEKAAKARLYFLKRGPWGHSVSQLLLNGGVSDEDLLHCARELDLHYIPSRYPNAHPSGTPHEVYDERISARALECARRIVEYVRGRLS